MFFLNQNQTQKDSYQNFLKIVGSLSNLFSDKKEPYLYYRIAEKIFCRAFDAEDLSRSDVSADAKKNGLGIGLKTFLAGNFNNFQKVAEFKRDVYDKLSDDGIVYKIAELRNRRLSFTDITYDLEKSIYHCVLREKNKFLIFEEEMHNINLEQIENIKRKKNSITFNDNNNEYSFLLSKSTLQKRFNTKPTIYEFEVNILKDPLADLHKFLSEYDNLFEQETRIKQSVYLPLYGSNKKVYDKSGLNQWNAGGRVRHPNEVYIPVPVKLHQKFPTFFPKKDIPFALKFPNGDNIEAKMCQAGRKALMTKSNRILGKLILRDGLRLKEGELATYEKLQLFGIDSVRIDKISDLEFEINFSKVDSFEKYKNNFL